jgi:hypothetical protein
MQPFVGSTAKDSRQIDHSASHVPSVYPQNPNISDFESSPSMQEPAVLCSDKMCDVDEAAKVESRVNLVLDFEPTRLIDLCKSATPPRRFHRTFWRGLASRLMKLARIKRRKAEAIAYEIGIQAIVHHTTR